MVLKRTVLVSLSRMSSDSVTSTFLHKMTRREKTFVLIKELDSAVFVISSSCFSQHICHSHKIPFKLYNIIFFLTTVTQVYKHDISKHYRSAVIDTICRHNPRLIILFFSRNNTRFFILSY